MLYTNNGQHMHISCVIYNGSQDFSVPPLTVDAKIEFHLCICEGEPGEETKVPCTVMH